MNPHFIKFQFSSTIAFGTPTSRRYFFAPRLSRSCVSKLLRNSCMFKKMKSDPPHPEWVLMTTQTRRPSSAQCPEAKISFLLTLNCLQPSYCKHRFQHNWSLPLMTKKALHLSKLMCGNWADCISGLPAF